jgi:hypothetical protein
MAIPTAFEQVRTAAVSNGWKSLYASASGEEYGKGLRRVWAIADTRGRLIRVTIQHRPYDGPGKLDRILAAITR